MNSSRSPLTGGFTLVELMVTITIIAILTTVAIPSFTRYIAGRNIDAQISSLSSAMRYARAEALKRGVEVTICPSADPAANPPTCGGGNSGAGWANGWVVFADFGTRGSFDTGDQVMQVQQSFANSGGIISSGANFFINYRPNGIAISSGGNLRFKSKSTPEDTSTQKILCVNRNGLSRAIKGTETCS